MTDLYMSSSLVGMQLCSYSCFVVTHDARQVGESCMGLVAEIRIRPNDLVANVRFGVQMLLSLAERTVRR
jgi:hypothetical protein